MTIKSYPPIDYKALKKRFGPNAGPRIVINPRTGNKQIQDTSNDVYCVIEVMGGTQKAAETLGVEEIEIEGWKDNHYVPDRYAEQINKITGWSVWSIQVPGCDVDGSIAAQAKSDK